MKCSNVYANKMPLIFLLIIIIVAGVYLFNTTRQPNGRFCSSEDPLYRTISAHASEWWEQYFSGMSPSTMFDFSSETGERFTAIKENTPDSLLFVIVEYDYPHTYFEHKGYIYAPNGIQSKRNDYNYTDIGNGIYCYEEI